MTHFVSESRPVRIRRSRCWPACLASVKIDNGNPEDKFVLRDELMAEISYEDRHGVTIDQAIGHSNNNGFSTNVLFTWSDILAELDLGHNVVLMVNYLYLIPSNYENAASWHAYHWVRLLQRVDAALFLLMDPLSWQPQPTGRAYEGLNLVTRESLKRAIEATPDERAGLALWVS